MFDETTADLIRQTPLLSKLDRSRLPEYFSAAFAKIASTRISLRGRNASDSEIAEIIADLNQLAAANETLVSTRPDRDDRKAASLVAGTAHDLMAQALRLGAITPEHTNLTAQAVSADIAATLLFLVAEAMADASQSAADIDPSQCIEVTRPLVTAIKAFAVGNLQGVLDQSMERSNVALPQTYDSVVVVLYREVLLALQDFTRGLSGVQPLDEAQLDALTRLRKARQLSAVHDAALSTETLSVEAVEHLGFARLGSCPGPHHLASLLIAAITDLHATALIGTSPPHGVPSALWIDDLKRPAQNRPFLWSNHSEAIDSGYLDIGCSAVVSFPTGSGKSTLAELKIAAHRIVLNRIVFIAPTHALVDQTRRNLELRFNNDDVSAFEDLDSIVLGAASDVLVMTPEAFLALMMMDRDALDGVGLLVFDECHLMHPRDNTDDRRAVDAMLCVLNFLRLVPEADVLLISAMIGNATSLAGWIEEISTRQCVALSLDYKPVRQLRGAVVYDGEELAAVNLAILKQRQLQNAAAPGVDAKRLALAMPHALVCLQQTWASMARRDYELLRVLENSVPLAVNNQWRLTPNSGELAATISAAAAESSIKTLIFSQTIPNTTSIAKRVTRKINAPPLELNASERILIERAALELGGLERLYLSITDDGALDAQAVVHHALLLPEERQVAEMLYRRNDGVPILCATSTLAQGMNLPSELVIIAEPSRFDSTTGQRELLEARELLNAAGRAGRAGEAANGMVLVIPSTVSIIDDSTGEIGRGWSQLRTIFGQTDRCVEIEDPIEHLLDEIQSRSSGISALAVYALRRLPQTHETPSDSIAHSLRCSFGAYLARKNNMHEIMEQRINTALFRLSDFEAADEEETLVTDVAALTGLPRELIGAIESELSLYEVSRHDTVVDWIDRLFSALDKCPTFITSVVKATSLARLFKKDFDSVDVTDDSRRHAIETLRAALDCWINGDPLCEIDELFHDGIAAVQQCTKARDFALRVVRDLSYLAGLPRLLSRHQEGSSTNVVRDTLDRCVRGGFSSPEQLALKELGTNDRYSRREVHAQYYGCQAMIELRSEDDSWDTLKSRVRSAHETYLALL